MSPALSVVVPVHNEAAFLERALPQLLEAVKQAGVEAEVLVVENGSSDDTAAVAQRLSAGHPVEVLSLPQPDYGAAMREGFLRARGEWVVNVDIDYFSDLFFRQVVEHSGSADLVIGSKRDPGSDDRRPPLRRVATKVFNLLLRTLFASSVSDTHGMKGFRREVVERVVPLVESSQDLFDTELVLRAERMGFRIAEVPVVVEELRAARSSLLKRVPRTLRGLWEIRRRI